MHECTHTSMLSHEQHVCVAGARADHRVLLQCRAVDDRREFLGQLGVRVSDADALPVHQVAAEIGGAERDRVARPGTQLSRRRESPSAVEQTPLRTASSPSG